MGRSERLADFLRYIADRSIRGDERQITEQQIGVHVFGRANGYDSNNDNIVRNYARTLRKRLEDYFRREGVEEPLTVMVPRGGYVPVFSSRTLDANPPPAPPPMPAPDRVVQAMEPDAPSAEAVPPGLEPSKDTAPANWRVVAVALCASLCAGLFGFIGGRTGARRGLAGGGSARPTHALWSQIFAANRDTFVVPSDGGLVMLESFSREQVDLTDYVNGNYRSPAAIDGAIQGLLKRSDAQDMALLAHKTGVLALRRYTSMVDLDTALQVARLPEVVPDHLVVRFARDLSIDDLRNGNAVLIGSSNANPWVALFESRLDFQFTRGTEFGGSGSIVNTHPLPHEQSSYASVTGDSANNTYGVIAFVPNLSGNGHVLLIEGVNMAGTQAAANLLMNEAAMRGLLDRALDDDGRLQSFEVLLRTNSVASNAAGVEVLSERIHPVASP